MNIHIFCLSPLPSESSDCPEDRKTRSGLMPPPRITSKWTCTCRLCGANGKTLSRSRWYRHNPGGVRQQHRALAGEVEPLRPAPVPRDRVHKRRRIEIQQDEDKDEDPLHISMQASGSSSVRTVAVCASKEQC